jgi:hypothetical protein
VNDRRCASDHQWSLHPAAVSLSSPLFSLLQSIKPEIDLLRAPFPHPLTPCSFLPSCARCRLEDPAAAPSQVLGAPLDAGGHLPRALFVLARHVYRPRRPRAPEPPSFSRTKHRAPPNSGARRRHLDLRYRRIPITLLCD